MAYITKAQMILEFGEPELIQLTNRTGTGTVIDDDVLDQAMLNAEGEVDSYIGTRYELPLPSVPTILTAFTCDIARYRLYDDQSTDEVLRRYERAIAWLRDIAKGVVGLGIKLPDIAPVDACAITSSREQVFTDTLFAKMGPTWP